MRLVLQRVRSASVSVEGRKVGSVGRGLLLLVAFTEGDDEGVLDWMARKVVGLRVFNDEFGKLNRSLAEVGGGLLVVSQFTLYGDAGKGRRPSFVRSAPPELAVPLYRRFLSRLEELVPGRVEAGEFGAMMEVALVNDGPVTLLLERGGDGDAGWS